LRIRATQSLLERTGRTIQQTERLIEESRKLLARPAGPFPSRAAIPGPARRGIAVGSSTPLVSRAVLNGVAEALRCAELEYGEALLALSSIWERLEVSLTDALFREERAAKAAYDRAAARRRELEVRWLALRVAAASEEAAIRAGPAPRERLH
ncbi:hypothetical protein, partial [Microvirga massiliensis]|uniref:hypothetical protein n=1 Tax=Microvirga massiliensis TaxID=1033741 RepID=UPI00062BD038